MESLPAQQNVVVENINFNVLQTDNLIPFLRQQPSEQTSEFWAVIERYLDSGTKLSDQGGQHSPRRNIAPAGSSSAIEQD